MRLKAREQRSSEPWDQASENIHQAFSFVERVIDYPAILDELPDKAMLAGRDLIHRGHEFNLIAAREEGASEWVARPIRYTLTLDAPYLQRPLVEEPSGGADPVALTRLFSATAETADAAFDDLTALLRIAVDGALRVDDGEPADHRG